MTFQFSDHVPGIIASPTGLPHFDLQSILLFHRGPVGYVLFILRVPAKTSNIIEAALAGDPSGKN